MTENLQQYFILEVEDLELRLSLNAATGQLNCTMISSDLVDRGSLAFLTPSGVIEIEVSLNNPPLPTQGGIYRCIAFNSYTSQLVYSNSLYINNGRLCFALSKLRSFYNHCTCACMYCLQRGS